MRSLARLAAGLAVLLLLAVASPRASADIDKQIKVLQRWGGVIKDDALHKESPATGYIANQKAFERLWKAWRPDEKMPEIDFKAELVLVGTAPGPNKVTLIPQVDERGNLQILARATLIGGAGFGYEIVTVKREGIKTVKGKPISDD
jgi:hypothetical protein